MLNIHVCISGFTQHRGQSHGIFQLAEKLIVRQKINVHNRVWLCTWRENWQQVAANVKNLAEFLGQQPRIGVYAYSWGAGWGAVRFADELQKYRLNVDCMVLSDPVYRHPNPLLRWKSLLKRDTLVVGEPVIETPHNVLEVYSFWQTKNWPQGHRLLCGDQTLQHAPVQLRGPHEKMDDAIEFHGQALAVADDLRQHGCQAHDEGNDE